MPKQTDDFNNAEVKHPHRGVALTSFDQAVKEAQAYVLSVIPRGVSLVDRLIEERRDEARRE